MSTKINKYTHNDLTPILDFYNEYGYSGGADLCDEIWVAIHKDIIIGVTRVCREQGFLVLRGMFIASEYRLKASAPGFLLELRWKSAKNVIVSHTQTWRDSTPRWVSVEQQIRRFRHFSRHVWTDIGRRDWMSLEWKGKLITRQIRRRSYLARLIFSVSCLRRRKACKLNNVHVLYASLKTKKSPYRTMVNDFH